MKLPTIKEISGTGLPLPGADIDTDQIIPARYLKLISFKGIGKYAFYDLRFDSAGAKKQHPFNNEKYRNANILLVNENFGCGSSREHAPQSLRDYGIKALIGESFAEIFAGNCTALGMPAVQVDKSVAEEIQQQVQSNPQLPLFLNLETCTLTAGEIQHSFRMQVSYQRALIDGTWDSTEMLLAAKKEIAKMYNSLPYIRVFQEI